MPYEPKRVPVNFMSNEALSKIIRDLNNMTPCGLSFDALLKELSND